MERNREARPQKKPRVLAAAGAGGGELVSTAHPLLCICLQFMSVYTRRTCAGTLESYRHNGCKLACASQAVVQPAADVDAEADKEAALALDVKAIQAPLIFHWWFSIHLYYRVLRGIRTLDCDDVLMRTGYKIGARMRAVLAVCAVRAVRAVRAGSQ